MKTLAETPVTTKWSLDLTHSELMFKVKHLMISTVTGQFRDFTISAEAGEDFSKDFNVELVAKVDSIDTNNAQRDGHLKSADFFDADKFPQITFKSTSYEGDATEGKLYGDLTVKGITKNISFDVEQGGIIVDPYGQTKAAFSINGKISRKEFGLTWNAVTETGGVVVSDDVKFHAEIQLVKQA